MSSFGATCDDFGVSMYLSSKVELPGNRRQPLLETEWLHPSPLIPH